MFAAKRFVTTTPEHGISLTSSSLHNVHIYYAKLLEINWKYMCKATISSSFIKNVIYKLAKG
jgi:hypothetical protein